MNKNKIQQSEYNTSGTVMVKERQDTISVGYSALLAFIFGVIISPVALFPSLAKLHLQDIFASIAIIGSAGRLVSGSARITFGKAEVYYSIFVFFTGIGLFRLRKYDLWDYGFSLYGTTLKTLVIFLLLIFYISSFERFKKGFFIFLLAVSMFELHGLKAVLTGAGFHAGRFASWVGQISNSDAIGAFLVMMLPIQLELFLYYKSALKKYAILFFALVNIILLVLTQTRSAFLSFIIVLPLWIVRKSMRGSRVFVTGLLLVTLFCVGITLSNRTEYSDYFNRMKSIFISDLQQEDSNIQSRYMFWQQGLDIWLKFPIIGCGLGGLDPHETITKTEKWHKVAGEQPLSKYSLHQSFIQVLAERGTVGLVLFLLFLLQLFSAVQKSIKNLEGMSELGYQFAVAKGAQLSLVAYLVNAMFMTITESWMLIILAGFITALFKLSKEM